MKKKMLFLTMGAMLITAVALSVSMNLSANNADRSIMLANIEALAGGEGTPMGHCALVAGAGHPIQSHYFCDSQTNDTMFYDCPKVMTSNRYNFAHYDAYCVRK